MLPTTGDHVSATLSQAFHLYKPFNALTMAYTIMRRDSLQVPQRGSCIGHHVFVSNDIRLTLVFYYVFPVALFLTSVCLAASAVSNNPAAIDSVLLKSRQ